MDAANLADDPEQRWIAPWGRFNVLFLAISGRVVRMKWAWLAQIGVIEPAIASVTGASNGVRPNTPVVPDRSTLEEPNSSQRDPDGH